jgi:hypothetical protein
MRILMVGALSWNPERIRSLHERGHHLWGTWGRSMAWDQGPYPMLEDCVRTVPIEEAARTIAEQQIDCVYGLFQVYDSRLWGPAVPGAEHDVWTLLRVLFAARAQGTFDAPIIFHWGFDVHCLDEDVVRALDGQIFCNREQYIDWTTPSAYGGADLDLLDDCPVVDFLDGDRPKREFMTDDFAPRLAERTGQIHTVCIGRPLHIDHVAMARNGIHLHVYGNGVDDTVNLIARDVLTHRGSREIPLVREHLHCHPSLQPIGRSWSEVKAQKSRWVREFSQYDAGWSYIGTPLSWRPLQDASAIPNRLSTYLLAGLPVITDSRPDLYRYDHLARLGVTIDLENSDYARLRATLEVERRSDERRDNAKAARAGYSFDASIDALIAMFQRARDRYFTKPSAQRRHPISNRAEAVLVETHPAPRPGLLDRARVAAARPIVSARLRRIANQLRQ